MKWRGDFPTQGAGRMQTLTHLFYAGPMAPVRTVHGVVRGLVQGVAYRASFRREALKRGLAGWVRNQSDGSVEFVVQGESDRVREIVEWAHKGPTLARVASVVVGDADHNAGLTTFEIRYGPTATDG
jgi:acylphosphatase